MTTREKLLVERYKVNDDLEIVSCPLNEKVLKECKIQKSEG